MVHRFVRFGVACVLCSGLLGCADRRAPAAAETRETARAEPPADRRAAPPEEVWSVRIEPPEVEAPRRRRPERPADTWLIFREAFDERKDATCDVKWVGRNRFEIETRNISRVTADMSRLPDGAPKKGPWILIIDGQGVELTGFRPKAGYTGRKRDLIRSKNGRWTVDRKRLYRPGE